MYHSKLKTSLIVLGFLFLSGCAKIEIDTFEEWCRWITQEYEAPFWAIFPAYTINEESITEDYAVVMNDFMIQKFGEGRIQKAVWREGDDLHMVNLSGFFIIEPEELIGEWRDGIRQATRFMIKDPAKQCIYGTLVKHYNNLVIHSLKSDGLGMNWTDTETVITTHREFTKDITDYNEYIKALDSLEN